MGSQQESEFYDKLFNTTRKYSRHYKDVRYYPIWQQIMTKLDQIFEIYGEQELPITVLELGCGTGQFGHMLSEHTSYPSLIYHGYDFSAVGIDKAKRTVKDRRFAFHQEDVFTAEYPDVFDCAIALEVLEHVNDDKGLISKINSANKEGFLTYFIGSVPDFKSESHVRHFKNEQEVEDRYSDHFIPGSFRILKIIEHWFLFTGYLQIPTE